MYSSDDINDIFAKITEYYEEPIKIYSRCQSHYFYRVENLSEDELNLCAEHVAYRLRNTVSPQEPKLFLKLAGGYTFFAERLCAIYSELIPNAEDIILEKYSPEKFSNGYGEKYKGVNTILITDIITTARSTLSAHTKLSLRGIPVLSWVSLIDRTFGPGPVPVVSAFTGAPVSLLSI